LGRDCCAHPPPRRISAVVIQSNPSPSFPRWHQHAKMAAETWLRELAAAYLDFSDAEWEEMLADTASPVSAPINGAAVRKWLSAGAPKGTPLFIYAVTLEKQVRAVPGLFATLVCAAAHPGCGGSRTLPDAVRGRARACRPQPQPSHRPQRLHGVAADFPGEGCCEAAAPPTRCGPTAACAYLPFATVRLLSPAAAPPPAWHAASPTRVACARALSACLAYGASVARLPLCCAA
jgi:hypothetical protein